MNIAKTSSFAAGFLICLAAILSSCQKDVTPTVQATLTFTSGVTGEAGSYTMSFPATGGKQEIGISSNADYTVSSDAEWLTATSTKGATAPTSSSVTVEAKDNSGGAARVATLKIVYGPSYQTTIKVSQKAGEVKPFKHQAMLFRFTATWCGYCPYMERAVASARSQHPELFNVIAFYASNGLPDSFTPAAPYNVLSGQYGIGGIPNAVVDGRCSFGVPSLSLNENASLIIRACQEDSTRYPAQIGIALTTSMQGSTLSIKASVNSNVKLGNQKLCVAVTENGIRADQASYDDADNGTIRNCEHVDVIRKYLTPIAGDAIESYPGSTAIKTYKFEAPSGVNLKNCHVVAYVFTPYGTYDSSIHVLADANYFTGELASTYIANSVSCKAGESADFKYEK